MTDIELLLLAAKAAGYRDVSPQFNGSERRLVGVDVTDDRGDGFLWNPLADAGDALKLMAQLRLGVSFHRTGDMIESEADVAIDIQVVGDLDLDGRWFRSLQEPYGRNGPRSLCRAIVGAAAEIGKARRDFEG